MDLLGVEKETKAFLARLTLSLDRVDRLVDEATALVADARSVIGSARKAVATLAEDSGR